MPTIVLPLYERTIEFSEESMTEFFDAHTETVSALRHVQFLIEDIESRLQHFLELETVSEEDINRVDATIVSYKKLPIEQTYSVIDIIQNGYLRLSENNTLPSEGIHRVIHHAIFSTLPAYIQDIDNKSLRASQKSLENKVLKCRQIVLRTLSGAFEAHTINLFNDTFKHVEKVISLLNDTNTQLIQKYDSLCQSQRRLTYENTTLNNYLAALEAELEDNNPNPITLTRQSRIVNGIVNEDDDKTKEIYYCTPHTT